ncbi:hypothetical protein [Micromonospora sagamiensis]|uniref:Uncharacterized protein n=1 Tax=Micromonospora sagamiensis TaxID=47875 RepID=A0A562WJZ7_9ACTN|nr:hypothetical protein [Micromonospora sagamiensis]TWJ30217.1 hypothetical protein JD81_03754 [Micromonospora sagamiensis]
MTDTLLQVGATPSTGARLAGAPGGHRHHRTERHHRLRHAGSTTGAGTGSSA